MIRNKVVNWLDLVAMPFRVSFVLCCIGGVIAFLLISTFFAPVVLVMSMAIGYRAMFPKKKRRK